MKTLIFEPSNENLIKCAHAINASEIVAIPTETVYGLAANCFDVEAVEKVFKAKNRPTFDPLIVHVEISVIKNDTNKSILEYLSNLNLINIEKIKNSDRQKYELLMRSYWPGPLTIIFPKSDKVPDLVTSAMQTVAIRAPKHSVTQKLLQIASTPLCAPSANRFGKISPTKPSDVFEELNGLIPYIIDGGECEVGLESTVISLHQDSIHIFRPGALTSEMLSNATGMQTIEKGSLNITASSPGMLENHYAPKKPLLLFELLNLNEINIINKINTLQNQYSNKIKNCTLLLNTSLNHEKWKNILPLKIIDTFYLNDFNDLDKAGKYFFETLRNADHSISDCIIAEQFSEDQGIGHAIIDRLKKASTKL